MMGFAEGIRISGGIEWCFPNHYRTTTLLPADYRTEKNEDGSATVWIGETERNGGLRGVVGVTLLYPENLEVGKPLNDGRNAMIYYFIAENYKKLRQGKKAKEFYKMSTQVPLRGYSFLK